MANATKKQKDIEKLRYLWLAITPDEYELPLCVEDTAEALGEKLGISPRTVTSLVSKNGSGKTSGRKIIRVSLK